MNTRLRCLVALSLVASLWTTGTRADDVDDLRNLRDTTTNLIDLLVKQGVLTREKADDIILQAHQQANGQEASEPSSPASPPVVVPASAAPVTPAVSSPTAPVPATAAPEVPTAVAPAPTSLAPGPGAAQPPAANSDNAVRVPYVPEIVKQQIRDEIKKDVLAQAKAERWGDPGALPEWLNRISWDGDLRLRGETDLFPTDGPPNALPAVQAFQAGYNNLYDTTETRNRLRVRARFGLQAKIADTVTAGLRLATGAAAAGSNPGNPSSENITLGNYDGRYAVGFDRAYLNYQPFSWLSVTGGRFGNPFFAPTDLVWNDTFSPEGVVAKFSGDVITNRLGAILIAGAFPIQQQDNGVNILGTNPGSKWLFGYQTGLGWQISRYDDLKFGVAFYDYRHVEGIPNPDPTGQDTPYSWTAAGFRQKGNSVFDINYASDNANGVVDPSKYLYGLVSKFRELNLSSSLDIGDFAPIHVIIDADFVRNLGFDSQEIQNRAGAAITNSDDFRARVNGYQSKVTIGTPKLSKHGDWQTFVGYRRLERDAVLDAFTDTDFHLGGTDAKGYFVGGKYGLAKNTVVGLRWLSASEISNPPLAIDVLQLDVSVSF